MMTNSGRQELCGGSGPTGAAAATEAAPRSALRTARRAAGSADRRKARHPLERPVATLSAAKTALAAADDEPAGFAYAAAHELRTPLRTIDGFSRLLLEGYGDKLDGEGRRLLGVMRDGVRRMSRLIDDMLALCRLGRQEMSMATVDMAALVASVLATPPFSAAGGGRIAFDTMGLPRVRGDRRLLEHVWFNLLENAVKFATPKPAARIEVGGTAGDGEIVYYVRDNGVGFDMRHADRLFGAFQRLHGEEFFGTGVGLAIVKRIVERHGGRVWAEGTPGEGATFCFALPD